MSSGVIDIIENADRSMSDEEDCNMGDVDEEERSGGIQQKMCKTMSIMDGASRLIPTL